MRIVKLTKWSYRACAIKGSASMPSGRAMLCLEIAPVTTGEKPDVMERLIAHALNTEGWFNAESIEKMCMEAFHARKTEDGLWEHDFRDAIRESVAKAISKSISVPPES